MNAQEAIELISKELIDNPLDEDDEQLDRDFYNAISILLESAKKFEETQKDNEVNLKLWTDEHNNEPKI